MLYCAARRCHTAGVPGGAGRPAACAGYEPPDKHVVSLPACAPLSPAVIDWLEAAAPVTEDFILVIDADMILRRPILPQVTQACCPQRCAVLWTRGAWAGAAPARPARCAPRGAPLRSSLLAAAATRCVLQDWGVQAGTAMGGFFAYLDGVHNALAGTHVPEVAPRNDTRAGPEGRRGDQARRRREPAGPRRGSLPCSAGGSSRAVCGCMGHGSCSLDLRLLPFRLRSALYVLCRWAASTCW